MGFLPGQQHFKFQFRLIVQIFTLKASFAYGIPVIFGCVCMFSPTSLTSIPPKVMLLNYSTTMRDSATDIKKKHTKKVCQVRVT